MAAGASAALEAERCRFRIEEYERLLRAERERLGNFQVASRTEKQVGARLAAMSCWGWHLLADRRWPGTRSANVDMILVGPGGVLVIDVKGWAEPRVERGVLFRGEAEADDDVLKLARVTELVEEALAETGLVPTLVRPVMVFANRRDPDLLLDRVRLIGEERLVPFATALPTRLSEDEVLALGATLAVAFPAYEDNADPATVQPQLEPVLPRIDQLQADEPETLFDVDELVTSMLEAQMAAPVEDWMTFLHPEQVRLVRTTWNGPARVRGPAGTGKTVVGLHRAAYLTSTRAGRVLYVSFVRTLPVVLSSLYARMSPTTCDRVEFTGLHRFALKLLRERGIKAQLDPKRCDELFAQTWAEVGAGSAIGRLGLSERYWREEIDYVLKGRGLTRFSEYQDLKRVGRRTRLQAEHRAAVWDVYRTYSSLLREANVCDFNDVLLLALTSLQERPLDEPYAAVIVDEVQDLTCVGLRLLHAVVGDAPDGLLVIGDGQQAVYPGGFTLFEAGISVTGRSKTLAINYRNAAEILERAATVVREQSFEDMDGEQESGRRELTVVRSGGRTAVVRAPDAAQLAVPLLDLVRRTAGMPDVHWGDLGVLCRSRREASGVVRRLERAGVPVVRLEDYDGTVPGAVKVGTYKRAKGLEFKYVFLPYLREEPPEPEVGESEQAYRERVELLNRELYVAMTRARDGLWLGYVSGA